MIAFQCSKCGEEMEIHRKMVGKKVRCVECGARAQVPDPSAQRQRTDEENEYVRRIMDKADQEHHEREKRDAESPLINLQIGWLGRSDVGFAGGAVMITGAVLWFAAGLSFGRIFFYPVILLVLGIVSIVNALITFTRLRSLRKRRPRRSR